MIAIKRGQDSTLVFRIQLVTFLIITCAMIFWLVSRPRDIQTWMQAEILPTSVIKVQCGDPNKGHNK